MVASITGLAASGLVCLAVCGGRRHFGAGGGDFGISEADTKTNPALSSTHKRTRLQACARTRAQAHVRGLVILSRPKSMLRIERGRARAGLKLVGVSGRRRRLLCCIVRGHRPHTAEPNPEHGAFVQRGCCASVLLLVREGLGRWAVRGVGRGGEGGVWCCIIRGRVAFCALFLAGGWPFARFLLFVGA
jgi:hypothetical protein